MAVSYYDIFKAFRITDIVFVISVWGTLGIGYLVANYFIHPR